MIENDALAVNPRQTVINPLVLVVASLLFAPAVLVVNFSLAGLSFTPNTFFAFGGIYLVAIAALILSTINLNRMEDPARSESLPLSAVVCITIGCLLWSGLNCLVGFLLI